MNLYGRKRDRKEGRYAERQTETENSELYYPKIEILGNSLFLQFVLAKLHRHDNKHRQRWIIILSTLSRYHKTVATRTAIQMTARTKQIWMSHPTKRPENVKSDQTHVTKRPENVTADQTHVTKRPENVTSDQTHVTKRPEKVTSDQTHVTKRPAE